MRIAALVAVPIVLVFSLSAAALLWADEKPKEPAWKDLFNGKDLAGWRQSNYGGGPDVTVEDGKIVIPLAERLAGITYDGDAAALPKSNYEVELEARRVQGTDFFVGLTFPVGEATASLILGGWEAPSAASPASTATTRITTRRGSSCGSRRASGTRFACASSPTAFRRGSTTSRSST